jgi:opacity protein-like surface antigen
LNKNIVVGNRLYGGLTFYGLMGGVYSIPAHQALKVEVYEFNPNREYNMMLSTFSNNLNTWGITMGLGAEYELNNKWGLWVEPTYHRLLTSMVANMPLRTYTSSIGVKFGISYYFGNPPKVQRRK